MSDHHGRVLASSTRPLLAVLVGCLVVAACGQPSSAGGPEGAITELQGVVVDPAQPKPEFTLTDTSGAEYDFAAETEGKITLLYFGYLNCPDICPVHLAQIAESLDRLPELSRETEVVFVSVDPGRDSPDDIRAFLDNFDTDFTGLTGTIEELEVAQLAAGVPAATFVGEGEDYTVNHAAQVIAFAPDGLSHSIYPFGVRQSQWDNDLQVLAEMTG